MKNLEIINHKSGIGGSVLILVLWVLFALTALTVAVGSHVSATMSLSERLWRITESRALAEAGAHQALMATASYANGSNVWDGVSEESWNRDQDLFSEIEVGGGICSVYYLTVADSGTIVTNTGIIGEDGKLNINAIRNGSTRKALGNLIELVGEVDNEISEEIVNSIARWIGADQSEDEGLTDEGDSDYYEQPSPMKSIAELRMVSSHVDDELYSRLLPHVTVYVDTDDDGIDDHLININCASAPVLAALAAACDSEERDEKIYRSLALNIIDFQKSGNTFEGGGHSAVKNQLKDFVDLSGEEGGVFDSMVSDIKFKSSAFRGISSGIGEDGSASEVSVEFVCDTESKKFVYWHEIQ